MPIQAKRKALRNRSFYCMLSLWPINDMGDRMNAKTIDSVEVVESGSIEGEFYFTTTCEDYDDYARLPPGVSYNDRQYGLTGWNSDVRRAYYKSSKVFARPIK
jgi:hypothetical protein